MNQYIENGISFEDELDGDKLSYVIGYVSTSGRIKASEDAMLVGSEVHSGKTFQLDDITACVIITDDVKNYKEITPTIFFLDGEMRDDIRVIREGMNIEDRIPSDYKRNETIDKIFLSYRIPSESVAFSIVFDNQWTVIKILPYIVTSLKTGFVRKQSDFVTDNVPVAARIDKETEFSLFYIFDDDALYIQNEDIKPFNYISCEDDEYVIAGYCDNNDVNSPDSFQIFRKDGTPVVKKWIKKEDSITGKNLPRILKDGNDKIFLNTKPADDGKTLYTFIFESGEYKNVYGACSGVNDSEAITLKISDDMYILFTVGDRTIFNISVYNNETSDNYKFDNGLKTLLEKMA